MAKILQTPLAKKDLVEIWSYIARDNPTAADQLLKQIDIALTQIASTPDLGFRLDAIREGVRCKPVKRNYLIFYEHREDTVHVLRVLHAARNHEGLL